MKQDMRNNSSQDALRHNRANKFFNRLAAEKKKTVFAVCLITLMVFMWVRVLGKKMPETAEATLGQPARRTSLWVGGEVVTSDTSKSNPELKVTFIELPKVSGRNNSVTRDFFDSDDWWRFIIAGEERKIADIEEVSVLKGGSEEIARQVAERLKLEAIGFGEHPRAFINGKPLSVGDKLLIVDGGSKPARRTSLWAGGYECEVVGIEEDKVFIRCREAEITLKLKRIVDVTN